MQNPVPAATGSAGMVCSIDRRASEAGVRMLAGGGNAVDAAVATAAVLAVVAPNTCGMGGDMFALVGTGHGTPLCLNGSGRAPSGASAERVRSEGHSAMPRLHHPAAVTVPGCVDGWLALHSRLGSANLPEVLGAAHTLAADGFAASADLAAAAVDVAGVAGNTDIPGDLRAGATVRRPGSARALEALATGGRDAFYGGEFGEALLGLADGLFSPDDLAAPAADWVEPATVEAWGHRLWTVPPNSQGYLILAAAALVQGLDLPADPDDPDWAHRLIEAARAVGSFRPAQLSDAADVRELLDPARIAELRRRVLAGDTLYIAGQLGRDRELNPIQDREAQFRAAFENVGKVLHAAGADFRHVVELETYFTHFQEDFPIVLAIKNRYFPTDGLHWTGWEVRKLVMGLRLEVKCTAVLTD